MSSEPENLSQPSAGELTARVCESYRAAYPEPLKVRAGETSTMHDKESEWPGWVWCVNPAGQGGWVPARYVAVVGGQGRMLQDYEATELTVEAGDVLTVLEEESGWLWCGNAQGCGKVEESVEYF